MPTLDKFILQLAEKAGIPASDQKLVDLLSNTELNRVNVNDELVNGFERSLLSINDAKANHPAIKTHYFAEIMSNVDRALAQIYTDFEFSDEEKAELDRERSSTKRINLVAAKLKERYEAEKKAGDGKKDPTIQQHLQTINDLNGQLASLKTQMTELKKSHTDDLNKIKLDTAISGKLTGLKTTLDTLPSDVRAMSIKNLLDKELQDNDVQIVMDEHGTLKLQKKDGSNYFDEQNRQVTVEDFIGKALTKNKVLQNTAQPKGGETQPKGSPTEVLVDGKPKTDGSYSMKSLIDESMASLKNPNPVSVLNTAE